MVIWISHFVLIDAILSSVYCSLYFWTQQSTEPTPKSVYFWFREEQSDSCLQFWAAAVVFNLALAHHRQASAGDKNSRAKVEKFYVMTLKLLSGQPCDMRVAVLLRLCQSWIRWFGGWQLDGGWTDGDGSLSGITYGRGRPTGPRTVM